MNAPTKVNASNDTCKRPTSRLGRRRFAFWVGFGLFSLGERLRAESLDSLAAAVMRAGGTDTPPLPKETLLNESGDGGKPDPLVDDPSTGEPGPAEHWTFEENERWYWFERETFVDDQWKLTGRTRPVHKHTGSRAPDAEGYVADDEVPLSVRRPPPGNNDGEAGGQQSTDDPSAADPSAAADLPAADPHDADDPSAEDRREVTQFRDASQPRDVPDPPSPGASSDPPPPASDAAGEPLTPGQPSAERRARHGRPPSRWLRSLRGDELRTWLATVDVPEAGVSGMTFWVHLTRDHRFYPEKLAGLTTEEQAKLHAAAHHGY